MIFTIPISSVLSFLNYCPCTAAAAFVSNRINAFPGRNEIRGRAGAAPGMRVFVSPDEKSPIFFGNGVFSLINPTFS
jgi:hypothetical protein